MPTEKQYHLLAVTEALLATITWGSSFVLVKIGLKYLGPLTIAGLRYFLAFLILLPFMFRNGGASVSSLTPSMWLKLFLLGLSAYTIGNGALFWGLKFLPATTASFLMSFTPILVLVAGIFWLKEIPTGLQILGMIVVLVGTALFFSSGLGASEPLGIGIVVFASASFALFGVLGRDVARAKQVDTVTQTAIPLGLGGGLVLLTALLVEGVPTFSLAALGIILFLALVNTAIAYMLYNHALQKLTALEINVLLNLSPLMTALLAWVLIDEKLGPIKIFGMWLTLGGVFLVQWRKSHSSA
ncbi:DMT family transporter [Candidatus Acetothermia bacterium]|nr:DMT family transporter [Candidatus Acetothermia bacterium]